MECIWESYGRLKFTWKYVAILRKSMKVKSMVNFWPSEREDMFLTTWDETSHWDTWRKSVTHGERAWHVAEPGLDASHDMRLVRSRCEQAQSINMSVFESFERALDTFYWGAVGNHVWDIILEKLYWYTGDTGPSMRSVKVYLPC